mgnify:CR=1 FL=1
MRGTLSVMGLYNYDDSIFDDTNYFLVKDTFKYIVTHNY